MVERHHREFTTVADTLREKRDEKTVGYGDEYDSTNSDNLIVEMNNKAGGVTHAIDDKVVGYDLTTFEDGLFNGAEAFVSILRSCDIDPVEDYIRVYRDMGYGCETDYPPRYLHCWVTDDILIFTTNNPITGESHTKKVKSKQGEAGFITIIGKDDTATKAMNKIDASSKTKGKSLGTRIA